MAAHSPSTLVMAAAVICLTGIPGALDGLIASRNTRSGVVSGVSLALMCLIITAYLSQHDPIALVVVPVLFGWNVCTAVAALVRHSRNRDAHLRD